jgi:hypothetical protein
MSRYRKSWTQVVNEVYNVKKEQDEKDHEISMARGELEAIADKATQLASALKGKSDEGNPLEAWVQSKITKAKDYINSVSDYLMYNPDMKQNEETILEYTQQQIKMAYGILNDPRYKGGNYDGAVKAIEKLAKGLSNHPDVKNALKRANETTIEAATDKEIDAFHKELDKVVHKHLGNSSDEKKKEMKEAKWEIEGRVSYKGVSAEDSFHMVIDAPTESAAEDKAYDELEKARKQRKIGPGGGGSIDDMEIESIEKTNDRLQAPTADFMGNSYDPTQKEEVHPHVKKMVKDGESDEKIKKMHPELKDDELEKLKETHSFVTNKQNEKQKEVGGEKEPIKTTKNEWKTFAMMAAELREKKEEKKEDKKEMQAGDDTRDKKIKTMTGEIATTPEMNPKVDYKY